MLNLTTQLSTLRRVGPKYSQILKKIGLETIQDLFFYFPHRYEDLSEIKPIIEIRPEQKITIQGEILSIQNSRSPRKRMAITEAVISDQQASLRAVWFNQPFLVKTLQPGKIVNLAGKVRIDNQGIYLSSPIYEILKKDNEQQKDKTVHTARLVPMYHETYNLSSRYLRYLIKPLLPLTNQIKDWLPLLIKQEQKLLDLSRAVQQMHFPDSLTQATEAEKRLSFDEMFLIQLLFLRQKQKIKQQKALAIDFNLSLVKNFVSSLPFKLTNAQRRAAWEIFQDLKKPEPMNRLLEGDVGSGKTVVATMAALSIAKAGLQVALMAPTEILAYQHFKEVSQLLKKLKMKIGLLTSSSIKISQPRVQQETSLTKLELLRKIKQGEIEMVVGTHSLIQEGVQFKNLALAIIDEQHRFGVKQRAKLIQSNTSQIIPHLLSLSATPIPRSLSLALYGDLDLSLLDEMPQGRQKIITQIVTPAARRQTYQFIRKEIKKGRQAFVICPRIEINQSQDNIPITPASLTNKSCSLPLIKTAKLRFWLEKQFESEIKAVSQEYQKLSQNIFPDLKIAMLHGQLKPQVKQQVMQDFKQGKIDILIATSVVEVGIDVANATVMMIESAERFGLAQLHQFRGRVGRGPYQSYCFIFTEQPSKKTLSRLRAILETEDGFALAEKDLQIRGPGQFFGSQQSGLPDLAMKSLTNPKLIYQAHQAAQKLLSQDSQLKKYPLLQGKLTEFQKTVHLE